MDLWCTVCESENLISQRHFVDRARLNKRHNIVVANLVSPSTSHECQSHPLIGLMLWFTGTRYVSKNNFCSVIIFR